MIALDFHAHVQFVKRYMMHVLQRNDLHTVSNDQSDLEAQRLLVLENKSVLWPFLQMQQPTTNATCVECSDEEAPRLINELGTRPTSVADPVPEPELSHTYQWLFVLHFFDVMNHRGMRGASRKFPVMRLAF